MDKIMCANCGKEIVHLEKKDIWRHLFNDGSGQTYLLCDFISAKRATPSI